jgi:hypothetical protein
MIMFEEKENFAYIEYDSEYKKKEMMNVQS